MYAALDRLETVYNIEVEEFHSYFVGVFGVWVHDKSTTSATTTILKPSTPNEVPLALNYQQRVPAIGADTAENIAAI
jgi:hypothetical protein